eukprot:21160_1
MSSRKEEINNLLCKFIEAQGYYHHQLEDNIQQVITKFNEIEDAINKLPSSYQERLILITASLEQWQGLIHANYALQLCESMESYSNIRKKK